MGIFKQFNYSHNPISSIIRRLAYKNRSFAVMLHRVVPNEKRSKEKMLRGLELTPEFLDKFILFFKNEGFDFLNTEEFGKAYRHKEKTICITLDDGYADNYQYAFPIFKKHNVPFTVYIATDILSQRSILWWYGINDLVKLNTVNNSCNYTDLRTSFLKMSVTKNGLKNIRDIFLNQNLDPYKWVKELAITEWQVKEMLDSGLAEIGCHTITHRPLNSLDENTTLVEMGQSKVILEQVFNTKVTSIAYPYGDPFSCAQREFRLAKSIGFKLGFTTEFAIPNSSTNPLAIPRINLSGTYSSINHLLLSTLKNASTTSQGIQES